MSSDTEGDDGEYFEIYNPYSTALSVEGWQLSIGQGGQQVPLTGQIPAHGYLVVTDDRDNSHDITPEPQQTGMGSFYDIFGRVGDGDTHRLVESPPLLLPNSSATLYLRDDKGNLIDYFSYRGMATGGVRNSAQRTDPRVHDYEVHACTPLQANQGDRSNTTDFKTNLRNHPFKSATELLRIPAYLPEKIESDRRNNGLHPQLTDSTVGLDARLLDVFALGGEKWASATTDNQDAKKNTDKIVVTSASRDEDEITSKGLRLASGRINLNTAPRAVLIALPGMTDELADRIIAWRDGGSTARIAKAGMGITTTAYAEPAKSAGTHQKFSAISDFLTNTEIWQGYTDEQKLELYRGFANLITTNSQVFQVESQNRPETLDTERKPSQAMERIYMVVDAEGRFSALNWRFVR